MNISCLLTRQETERIQGPLVFSGCLQADCGKMSFPDNVQQGAVVRLILFGEFHNTHKIIKDRLDIIDPRPKVTSENAMNQKFKTQEIQVALRQSHPQLGKQAPPSPPLHPQVPLTNLELNQKDCSLQESAQHRALPGELKA